MVRVRVVKTHNPILVEKVIIPVSDTAKHDPVKKTSAFKRGEVADDCCSATQWQI